MRALIAAVFITACTSSPPAVTSSSSMHNVATDTVRYVETGSTCEPVFSEPEFQSARCTMPNGIKVYCIAKTAAAGANDAWSCVTLTSQQPAKAAGSGAS